MKREREGERERGRVGEGGGRGERTTPIYRGNISKKEEYPKPGKFKHTAKTTF